MSRFPTRSRMRWRALWSGCPGFGIGSRLHCSPRKAAAPLPGDSLAGRGVVTSDGLVPVAEALAHQLRDGVDEEGHEEEHEPGEEERPVERPTVGRLRDLDRDVRGGGPHA